MATEAEILGGLVARGVPAHIAQGIVANMIAESRLDPGINELAPVVPGSRGGFGLNQWTGPRRRAFEAFAADRGTSPADLDTQLDFTLWELSNTERAAGQALASAPDAVTAARVYSEKFLRPGIPHLDKRLSEAKRLAMGGYAGNTQAPMGNTQNALAPIEEPKMPWKSQRLDPAMFALPQNALAAAPIVATPLNYLARRA